MWNRAPPPALKFILPTSCKAEFAFSAFFFR